MSSLGHSFFGKIVYSTQTALRRLRTRPPQKSPMNWRSAGYDFTITAFRLHGMEVEGRDLYQNLCFPPALKLDERPLFERCQIITNEIVFLGKNFQVGFYYHPSCDIHPWVDRAFVALGNESDHFVVLFQDKINDDPPKAVAGLTSAAKLMSDAGWERVLCVAHVVDASTRTRAQNAFEYPYLLIRSDQLNEYYSLNFAPAIRYVRDRHQL